jgi:hypothetical protein
MAFGLPPLVILTVRAANSADQHWPLPVKPGEPAGGERLLRRAPGLRGTWVNGVTAPITLVTRAGPGEVLTRFKPGAPNLAMPHAGG